MCKNNQILHLHCANLIYFNKDDKNVLLFDLDFMYFICTLRALSNDLIYFLLLLCNVLERRHI